MSNQDDEKSIDYKIGKTRSNFDKAEKEVFSGVQEIKENVLGIARNIKDISTEKAHDAANYAHDQMDGLKETGTETLAKIEKRIKSKPGQSVAIAFATGLLASFLLSRRKS